MKRIAALLLAVLLVASIGSVLAEFKPERNLNWTVTSSAGGGSDIYTRKIADILKTQELYPKTILVTNLTDGGGEVGRLKVSITTGRDTDYSLLTFNSGDLMPMLKNTDNRIENFTPLAVLAMDKQLLFVNVEKGLYKSFQEVLDAIQGGKSVVVGGSKGDDIATYEALVKELKLTEKEMPYITYDGTGDAITALLGGHVDVLISKPAASSEYVEAKMITPILALSTERYGGNLADAPTLSEVGEYNDVEVPVWRGVVGPKAMSEEAVAYWSALLKTVSDSEAWKTEYLDANKLLSNYMDAATAKEFMTNFQVEYLKSIGK